MTLYLVINNAETESFTLDEYEFDRVQDELNDREIQFVFFERQGRKMMINKNDIIKIWWEA